MYFTNIAKDELQHFHNTSGADFTMSLTDILTSNLFEVETIITDNLYRVYPLFYCKEIIINNPNDKNLDNRVLILQKREHETYVSFMTEEQNNILLDETVLDIKQIGDKLSDADFNRMVYMFRKKGVLTGNIDFENNTTITGQYATYKFENVAGQLRNDTGLIVNEKIKNNPITVKLQSPFFLSAKYSLVCTVRSLTGANIYDDDTSYKVKDTFTIELVNGSSVAIDVSNYTNDSVLDFVMEVDISFDVPEIMNNHFLLSLSSSENFVVIGNDLLLTANLTGEGNVEGYTVKFYEDNAYIGLASTDENGVAVFEYTPSVISNHVYSARVFGLESNVNVEVGKYTTSINLTSNKDVAYIPTTFTLNGVCTRGNGVLSNASVKLLDSNILVDTLTTNNNGEFTKTITANTIQNYSFRAVYDGNDTNLDCISNVKNITARKLNTNLTINLNKSSMYYSETVTISGKLTDELGINISNASIKLYQNGNYWVTINTNTNGEYSQQVQYNEVGTKTFKAIFEGDGTHTSKESATKTLTINKAPTNMTITPSKSSYTAGEEITVTLSSNYGSLTADKIYIDDIFEVAGANNTFTFKAFASTDTGVSNIKYNGNSNYQSTNQNINVNNTIQNLTLSISGKNLIISTGVANFDLRGLIIHLPNTNMILSDANVYVTNSSGNYTYSNLGNIITGRGTIYATYGDKTSNTINYNW